MISDKPVIKAGIVILISFFMTGLLPFLGLFLFGGVESELFKAILYYSIGGLSLIALLALALLEKGVKSGYIDYEKLGWLRVFIYEPEESILGKAGLTKYLTFTNILHISIIFGLSFSLIGAITQTSFVALPLIEYQVTETGQIILATEPAASSETLLMMVIMSFLFGFSVWFIKTRKLPDFAAGLFYFFSSILIMAIWLGIHYVRYGGQETNFMSTAIFGFVGSLSSFIVGSPLIWYIWHVFNNLFAKAIVLFSSDIAVSIIFVMLAIYIGGLVIIKTYKYITKK